MARILFFLTALNLVGACDLFTLPEEKLIHSFKRLNETVEVADWLLRFENPAATVVLFFPVIPEGSLPLTSTSGVFSSEFFSFNHDVVCAKELCSGVIEAEGENEDGLVAYAVAGTWSIAGTFMEGSGSSRWHNGLSTIWTYEQTASAPGSLAGVWRISAPVSVTGASVFAHTSITYSTALVPVTQITVWQADGTTAIEHRPASTNTRFNRLMTAATEWPLPEYALVSPSGTRTHWYAPGVTSFEYQLHPGLPVWDYRSFFGVISTTDVTQNNWHSFQKYPDSEAYFSVEETAQQTASDTFLVERKVTTYDAMLHAFTGELTQEKPNRWMLFCKVDTEVYHASGYLRYERDIFGMTASWKGTLQELDGSALALHMWRIGNGQWHLTASYNHYPSEQFPDEELELTYFSDGAAVGTGFLVVPSTNDSALSGDAQARFPVTMLQPQPGARLTARD